MKPKVLIADEEAMFCEATAYILNGAGFETFKAGDAEQLLALARETSPDLVLLSETLPCCANPSSDALGACASFLRPCCELRENSGSQQGLILMWGTNPQAKYRIAALKCGADDYLVKPFGMRELVARLHRLLRRAGAPPVLSESKQLRAGALLLDAETRQVWIEEQGAAREIKLRPKEFDLLHFLMAHQGQIVAYDTLMERVWGRPFRNIEADKNLIGVYLLQLRRKLGDDAASPRFIHSVIGKGCILKVETQS